MGGKAFLASIPSATFPRMQPETYHTLKARHLAQLQGLFRRVGVPREAPGKETYGDIDYVVCTPLRPGAMRGEELKATLGAAHFITDNRAVNLAVHVGGVDEAGEYYQVDVNECENEDEWERVMFFQSYGDLGMILGVVARNNGLSLGLHGLKVPHSGTTGPFLLSADFERILAFFGLHWAEWDAGFASVQAVFEWVATSRLLDANAFRESARREQRRGDRKMYQAFLRWVLEQRTTKNSMMMIQGDEVVEEAKVFFGQKDAYEEEVVRWDRRRRVKEALSGKMVMEWTGRQGPAVRDVMDTVRKSVDEDDILKMTQEEMRSRVMAAHLSMVQLLAN